MVLCYPWGLDRLGSLSNVAYGHTAPLASHPAYLT